MTDLLTPKNVAELGIMSYVKQWQERKAGRLNHYKIGKKIFYSQAHIETYLKACEQCKESESLRNDA